MRPGRMSNCRHFHFPPLVYVDPALLTAPLDQGDDQNDQEQQIGLGGGVAHFVVFEGLFINAKNNHRGGASRAALSGYVDNIKHLEGGNKAQNGYHKGGGRKHGPGYMAEKLPAVGPVNTGRLVKEGRNVLQAAHKHNHIVAGLLPHHHNNDGGQRRFGGEKPLRQVFLRHAKRGKKIVDRPVGGHKQQHGNAAHRHHGGKVGEKADGLIRVCQRKLLVESQRQQQRKKNNQRHRNKGIDHVVGKGRFELRVSEKLFVIGQPHKGALVSIVVGKAHHKTRYNGNGGKNQKPDQVGQQIQIAHRHFVAGGFGHAMLTEGRLYGAHEDITIRFGKIRKKVYFAYVLSENNVV